MPEVNLHEEGGLVRLTQTEHIFEKGEFKMKQVPITDESGKALDGGGFESEAEAWPHQMKAIKQIRKREREGEPNISSSRHIM